jgi:hypothetical protein
MGRIVSAAGLTVARPHNLATKERMRWAWKTRQMLDDPEADFGIID